MATVYTLNGQTYSNNTGYIPVGATVVDFGDPHTNRDWNITPPVNNNSSSGTQSSNNGNNTDYSNWGTPEDGMGGARGLFDPRYNTPEQMENQANFDMAVINYGGDNGMATLNDKNSADLAAQYGLNIPGFDLGMFAGMTSGEAARKAQEQRDRLLGKTSANTSYSFNPESLASTKRASDRFQLSLDSINNDPFSATGDKQDKRSNLLESTANDFARGFGSAQEFYDALQNNPELAASLSSFIKAGGTPSQIASRIQTVTNGITAPQDTASYLDSLDKLTGNKTMEEQRAYDALTPERQIAQDEIARLAGIPKQLTDAYFGTETQTGIWEQKKIQAENAKQIIETKELNERASLREKAQYDIDKNNADAQIAQSEIETNRLQAKNYMTGMLAKLGALQTTGAAPKALSTLEQKYQQQAQQLSTKLSFANRLIQINLTKDINDLETSRDEKIQSINEDLTKTEEQITKEILSATNAANKEIYSITSSYATKLRSQTDKYIAETKSNSDKYLDSFLKLAGKGVSFANISKLIDANGRIIPNATTASIFGKSGSGSGSGTNFTAQEKRKLEQAGIDPVKDRKAALDYLYGDTAKMGKPSFSGEQLTFGNNEKKARKIVSNLETKYGVTTSDIVNVQNYLSQGYSLKEIAQSTGMPTEIFNELSKYVGQ